MRVELCVVYDLLAVPVDAIPEPARHETWYAEPALLVRHTEWGDAEGAGVDADDELIARCMYDLREMGAVPGDCDEVVLPRGRVVRF